MMIDGPRPSDKGFSLELPTPEGEQNEQNFRDAQNRYLGIVKDSDVVGHYFIGSKKGFRTGLIIVVLAGNYPFEEMAKDSRFRRLSNAAAKFIGVAEDTGYPMRTSLINPSDLPILDQYLRDGYELPGAENRFGPDLAPKSQNSLGKPVGEVLIGGLKHYGVRLREAEKIARNEVGDGFFETPNGWDCIPDERARAALRNIAVAETVTAYSGFQRLIELQRGPSQVLRALLEDPLTTDLISRVTYTDVRVAIESGVLKDLLVS